MLPQSQATGCCQPPRLREGVRESVCVCERVCVVCLFDRVHVCAVCVWEDVHTYMHS